MSKIKIEKEVKNLGDAQDHLRHIIRSIDQGIKKGDGWIFGEGEVEHEKIERPINPELNDIAFQLQQVAQSEAGSASFKLLNELAALLAAEGYGMGSEYQPHDNQDKPGSTEGATDKETVESYANTPQNASQEVPEGSQKPGNESKFPWEKNQSS